MPDTADQFDFTQYDYIIDAIDTVTGKLEIIKRADVAGVPVISSMGAGNKLDPTAFRVADIYQTKVCPLAKVMRRELKKAGIKSLKVVYSEEQPIRPIEDVAIYAVRTAFVILVRQENAQCAVIFQVQQHLFRQLWDLSWQEKLLKILQRNNTNKGRTTKVRPFSM